MYKCKFVPVLSVKAYGTVEVCSTQSWSRHWVEWVFSYEAELEPPSLT